MFVALSHPECRATDKAIGSSETVVLQKRLFRMGNAEPWHCMVQSCRKRDSMQVAVSTLYGPKSLTIVEAGEGTDAWIFIPLETGPATVHVFEGRYLFACGYRSDWAIFDLEQRRRITGPQTVLALPRIFCFSVMHRSFFLAGQRAPEAGYNRLHQIPVDSGLPRTHDLPDDAHVHQLARRDDGAIIGLSHVMEQGTVRHVLHPQTGEVQTDWLVDALYWSASNYGPRWISPDGRWALRNSLASPLLARGRRTGLLDRFMPEKHAGAKHPDLRDDGEPRYALALELIELEPLRKAITLMVAYRTPKELDLYPADVALLDAWFRRPAADRPMLLPRSHAESMHPEQAEVAELAKRKFLNQLDDVVWADDSRSFSIRVGEYKARTPRSMPRLSKLTRAGSARPCLAICPMWRTPVVLCGSG